VRHSLSDISGYDWLDLDSVSREGALAGMATFLLLLTEGEFEP
jgi:hypothetical protein